MLVLEHLFLCAASILSCLTALRWIGTPKRRCLLLSAIQGALNLCVGICGAYFLADRYSGALSLLVLIFYLPIALNSLAHATFQSIAAVSIACAGMGCLQAATGFLLDWTAISPSFRVALTVLVLGGCGLLWHWMSPLFPGTQWLEVFEDTSAKVFPKNEKEFCGLLMAYGLSCALPGMIGLQSVWMLIPVCFWQIGGLYLINLILSHQKEQQLLSSEQQYRSEMAAYMSTIRSQRHDYNFHVQTLSGLLNRGDYEGCKRYLQNLTEDSVGMNELLPLADPAISSLILSFRSRAQQDGIKLEISIENDLSQIATNVYETNKIIGNLLQNALDEARQLKDKSYGIHLSILKRGEFCMIHVSNRTAGTQPMAAYQYGKSQKASHEGIGIASIQALANRYGGLVYFRMEGDIIHFVAKIPLVLAKEAG